MRARLVWLGGAFALSATYLACTSLDGFSGGGDASDGGLDAAAPSPPDAAPASDGAVPGDAATCANVEADAKNCGRCGHDCHGGACTGGVCQPVQVGASVASFSGVSRYLIVTDRYVFYDFGTTVQRIAKDGSEAQASTFYTSSGTTNVDQIVADSARVYFAIDNPGQILACPIAGCGGPPSVIVSGLPTTQRLAVNGGNVFCAVPNGAANVGRVTAVPLDGGVPFDLAVGQNIPQGIVADATNVYWGNDGDHAVVRCSVGGCGGAPTLFASTPAGDWEAAIDDTYVYVESTAGAVYRVEKSSGVILQLYKSETAINGIAADGANVYWTEPTRVLSCPRGGCGANPTVIAGGQVNATGPAVDANDIYWLTGDSTLAVMRVAR